MDVKVLMATKSYVQLQINCTTLFTSSKIIILRLTNFNDAIKQSNKTDYVIECPINTTIIVYDLHPNTKYTVVAEYTLGSVSIECNLQTFTTRPGKNNIIKKLDAKIVYIIIKF